MRDQKLDDIFNKLLLVNHNMNENLAKQAKLHGYSSSDFIILMDLIVHPNSDLTSLYSRIGSKKSSVSKAVAKLVDQGAIIRTHPHADKRKVNLELNDELKEVLCRETLIQNTFSGSAGSQCNLDSISQSLDDIIKMLSLKEQ